MEPLPLPPEACNKCLHKNDMPKPGYVACLHPKVFGVVVADPITTFMMWEKDGYLMGIAAEMGVRGNEEAVEKERFRWPVEFNPADLVACDCFEPSGETHDNIPDGSVQ